MERGLRYDTVSTTTSPTTFERARITWTLHGLVGSRFRRDSVSHLPGRLRSLPDPPFRDD